MTVLKYTVYAMLLLGVVALLHYSLPSRDIVRITGHEIKRVDTGDQPRDGDAQTATRDVSFIYAVTPDDQALAYRNEDTDWGWPPYLKFDTADISARASNLISPKDDPTWVIVTHYGWRLNLFSMFENVVGLEEAQSKDQELWPWFNIAVITILLILFLVIRRYVLLFYGRHVDPLVDSIDEQWDDASNTVSERYRGVSGWFRKVTGR